MSCESESCSSGEALHSNEIGEEILKEPRISYTREFLLSLAELDACRNLPNGLDQSILSELEDIYSNTSEHQKSWCSESVVTGRMGGSTGESLDKWGRCKLSSQDAKIEEDAQPFNTTYSEQSRHLWGNSEIVDSWRSSFRRHNSILGKWSGSSLSQGGSEGSASKSLGTGNSLLSRCNQPYRPPSFYQAMSHSGRENHDSFNNETFGSDEGPEKERTSEERWRKASFELMRNEQLEVVQQKQKSRLDDQKENMVPDTCLPLNECSDVPLLDNNISPPIYPAVSGSSQTPCSTFEVAEEYLRKDLLINHSIIQANLAANDSSRDGQSVMVANVDFDILKKKELKTHDGSFAKSKEAKIINILPANTMDNTAINSSAVQVSVSPGSFIKPLYVASSSPEASLAQESKGINIAGKELHKVNTPLSSGSHHSARKEKLVDGSISEIWQSSSCTEHHDIIMEDTDSCRSHSKFFPLFLDNESDDVLPWGDENRNQAGGACNRMFMKENLIDHELSEEPSLHARKVPVSETAKADVSYYHSSCSSFPYGFSHDSHLAWEPQLDKFTRDQGLKFASGAGFQTTEGSKLNPVADSDCEIHLPDEDSLITIDDTFIVEQDVPAPSPNISYRGARRFPFPGSNHLSVSERLHRNLSWDNAWLHESQMNSRGPFINPSDCQAHPPTFQDTWEIYHNGYNPFAAGVVPHPFEQLPVDPRRYEPSVQHFLSPRVQPAESFCPRLGIIQSPKHAIYNQIHQIPCFQQEPTSLGYRPVNYQRNVDSTIHVGKRGVVGRDRNKSNFSQLLQMQMRLTQMNLEAVAGSERNGV